MKAKKHRILVLVVLLAIALFCDKCMAAEQDRFHSEANGYSIAVPNGWTQIPDDIVLEMSNRFFSAEGKPKSFYEKAFQRETAGTSFEPPYVIVQVVRYFDLGLNRQIYKSEFKEFVKGSLGIDTTDLIEKKLSTEAQGMMSESVLGKAYLDSENGLYRFGVEAAVHNVGKLKAEAVGHFGRHAIIQVIFYDRAIDWEQSKSERNLILGSFRFDPGSEHMESEKADSLRAGLLVKVIGGIIAGFAVALAFFLIHSTKAKRRISKSGRPSGNR
jgi:hypothetical protein